MTAGSVDDALVFRARRARGCVVWFHRSLRHSNQHCLYCGGFVGEGGIESDKEHLIGRRMTPRGLMADPTSFNFIFRACRPCNAAKAALEDQVAAVTLLTSPGREDPKVDADARRKASSSIDRRHRLPVDEVRNEMKISIGGIFTFTTVAPAQLPQAVIKALAFCHVQGLFSLATSSDPTTTLGTRLLPWAEFGFFGSWPYRDWGNPQLIEIAHRAHAMDRVAEITTADGFFRAALRKPPGQGPWFWALEWNQNYRVSGWIGNPNEAPPVYRDLPDAGWKVVDERTRMRHERPLDEAEPDLLFDPVA